MVGEWGGSNPALLNRGNHCVDSGSAKPPSLLKPVARLLSGWCAALPASLRRLEGMTAVVEMGEVVKAWAGPEVACWVSSACSKAARC